MTYEEIKKKLKKKLKKIEKEIKETNEFLEMMQYNNNNETLIDYTLVDDILSSIPR